MTQLRQAVHRVVDRLRPAGSRAGTVEKRPTRVAQFRALISEMSVHELAAAHVALHQAERSAPNNYFNPERPWQHLRKYVDAAPAQFLPDRLEGASVLEFGSGTRNVWNLAAALLVNGAGNVTTYEPGKVLKTQSELSYREFLAEIVRTPSRYALAHVEPEHVRSRAVALLESPPPYTARSRQELLDREQTFDLILSNHVLEHVDDVRVELDLLDRLSRANTAQIHRVDFRDHRLFSDRSRRYDPLEFYLDGRLTTCNGLRASDVEQAFVAAGYEASRVGQTTIDVADLPSPIIERFAEYEPEDLAVLTADWLVTRG